MRTAILTIALAVCTLSAPASATPFASVPHGVGVGLGEGATVTAGVRTSALVPRAYPTGESSPEPRPQWEEGARAIGRRDGHSGGHHGSSGHAAGSKPRPTPPGSPNKDGSHAIYPRNAAFSQFHRRTRTHPAPDNIVKVASSEKYCLMMPRDPGTNIGDSQHENGTQTFCSESAKYSDQQGLIMDGFWKAVQYKTGTGQHGKKWAQLTGCIRPEKLDRLNPSDAGGQYDSDGGYDGQGNPRGSACHGYRHYVLLLEPSGSRACIRCCDDPVDCPVQNDTQGCPAVVPGEYFDCD